MNNKPMYLQIYDQLISDIQEGRYRTGDRLPSEKELAVIYKVSRITSKKALEMLADKGYIKRMPGKGSFVEALTGNNKNESHAEIAEIRKQWKIGVVMDTINDVFGSGIFLAIENLAETEGFFIIPRVAYGRRDKEEEAIQSLLDFGVDGMILMTSHSEDINPGLMRLVLNKVPLVLVDRFLKGIPAPFVGTDNVAGTILATDYILKLGHRHISFLTRPYRNTMTIENRMTGFVRSHAEHGIAIDESKWITDISSIMSGYYSKESVESDINKIKKMIENNKDLTCFFAAEYNIAVLAKKAVEDMKLHVPEDISIVCFDGPDDFIGESFFTRVVQKEKEIGIKAVELLMEQIENHVDRSDEKIFFDANLVVGISTALPRSK